MKNIIIAILIILLILCILQLKESYTSENINTDTKILNSLRNMLKLVDNLFEKNGIKYWIDSGTLLGAERHQDIIPWDDDADLAVFKEDEQKLLNLKPILNTHGYDITTFWGGYKIFHLNGSEIKYYNRNWFWSKDSKDIEESENFNYKYPFIDICIVDKVGESKYHYTNLKVRKVWSDYYQDIKDLFPLKRYRFNNFTLLGPNNPKPFLDRAYGNDWKTKGYRQYDHENQQMLDKIKFNL
jgi:lipopolysaccharide cholinephosphotransferase